MDQLLTPPLSRPRRSLSLSFRPSIRSQEFTRGRSPAPKGRQVKHSFSRCHDIAMPVLERENTPPGFGLDAPSDDLIFPMSPVVADQIESKGQWEQDENIRPLGMHYGEMGKQQRFVLTLRTSLNTQKPKQTKEIKPRPALSPLRIPSPPSHAKPIAIQRANSQHNAIQPPASTRTLKTKKSLSTALNFFRRPSATQPLATPTTITMHHRGSSEIYMEEVTLASENKQRSVSEPIDVRVHHAVMEEEEKLGFTPKLTKKGSSVSVERRLYAPPVAFPMSEKY